MIGSTCVCMCVRGRCALGRADGLGVFWHSVTGDDGFTPFGSDEEWHHLEFAKTEVRLMREYACIKEWECREFAEKLDTFRKASDAIKRDVSVLNKFKVPELEYVISQLSIIGVSSLTSPARKAGHCARGRRATRRMRARARIARGALVS
jgi:hypothetical protein